MALTLQERTWIEVGLEKLYEASAGFAGEGHSEIREYIDVGEYGLALDNLAYLYLEAAPKPLPAELQTLFDTLAAKMGMKDSDEWRGVAKIRLTTDLPAA